MSAPLPHLGLSVEQLFGVCLAGGTALSLLFLLAAGRGRPLPLAGQTRLRGPRIPWPARFPRLPRRVLRLGARRAAPWASPFLVSLFLTSFGASGLVLRVSLGAGVAASVAGALGCGALVASTLAFGASRWLREQDAETGTTILGVVGRVSLPIPAGGVGSIAYHVNGRRATMPARGRGGAALTRGRRVVVLGIEERVATVAEL